MKATKVTSIDKLREYAKGEVVTLSSFVEGEEFTVRLKRPSLYSLVEKGTIPNPLMNAAAEMFGTKDSLKKTTMKETAELLRIMAECALAEPTCQQLADCGLSLTDQQMIEIFNYTQNGIQSLSKFRNIPADSPGVEPKPEV